MTRDEASYILKSTAWLGTAEDLEQVAEAVNMATDALSAEAKGDLISRQDAVNTIKRYKHRLQGRGQTYGFLLEEFEHQIPSAENSNAKTQNSNQETQNSNGDLIYRADAIEAVMAEGRKVYTSEYAGAERIIYEADAVEALSMLQSADALHESCEDCPLYDHDKHNCPRFNKVIPQTIAELSAEAVQSEQYKKGFEDAKRAFLVEYARESENMRKRNAELEVMLNAYREISAEAVQGEWIKTVGGNGWNEWYVLKCPICGATIEDKHYHSWKYNFCPNCGADMRKEKK